MRIRTLVDLIHEDWVTHGRDYTRPGFKAIAVYRFGVWRMSIYPKLFRAPFSVIYRMLYRRARNVYGIEIPYTAKVGRRVRIDHQHGIVIHGNSEIGDECVLRQSVTLGNRYLDRPFDAPKLGCGVNVGAGAVILGSVVVGDYASIGANAVVLVDVPRKGLAVGVPAKIVNIS